MSTRTDAAARKARIKARLAQAEEPKGAVEAATVAHTEPVKEPEPNLPTPPEPAEPAPSNSGRGITIPAGPSQRSNKPPNYKLHVLTALTLVVVIRISRYGTKALTG